MRKDRESLPQRAHVLAVAGLVCRMREDRDCMPQRAYNSIYVKNERGPGLHAAEDVHLCMSPKIDATFKSQDCMPQGAYTLAVADVQRMMREDWELMPQRAYTSIHVKNESRPGARATKGASHL